MSTWASSFFGVTKKKLQVRDCKGKKNTELNSVEQMSGFFLNKNNEINWLVIFAVKVDPVWNKAFKVQDKLLYSIAYVEEGETVHAIGTLHSAKE